MLFFCSLLSLFLLFVGIKYFLIKNIAAIAYTPSNNSPALDDFGIKSNFLAIA